MEHRTHVESTLTSALPTRRMDGLVKFLGTTGMSKSQVSTMAKDLDSMVADFRSRPLEASPHTCTRRPTR